jgi:hypothetical protein
MNIKARISRLEEKSPCDLIAFFSLPERFSRSEEEKIKADLWDDYLKNGGNPGAYPAYIAGLTGENDPQFIGVEKRADVLAKIHEAGKQRMASMK